MVGIFFFLKAFLMSVSLFYHSVDQRWPDVDLIYMVWWCGCFQGTSSLKTHVKGEKIRFTCEATPICQVLEVDFRHQSLHLLLNWPRAWGWPRKILPSLELWHFIICVRTKVFSLTALWNTMTFDMVISLLHDTQEQNCGRVSTKCLHYILLVKLRILHQHLSLSHFSK